MSQEQVTSEELEAYWAKVAHDVDWTTFGDNRPDYGKCRLLDWYINSWQSELDSRGESQHG